MMFESVWLVCVVMLSCVSGRTISRYSDAEKVNLVEFNIGGVIYGRCSFNDKTEDITVIFEERGDDLSAKSFNPTVIDPVSQTRRCRMAATKPTTPNLDGRNNLSENSEEAQRKLYEQIFNYGSEMKANYEYVSHLQPRFIGKLKKVMALGLGLGAMRMANHNQYDDSNQHDKGVGITINPFGSSNSGKLFPGIHFMQGHKNSPHSSSIGFPKYGNEDTPGFGSILGGLLF